MEQQDWFEVEIRFLRRLLQSGQLALNQHAENNALASGKRSTGASETVPVVTLDHGMERYGWCDIGFLKLDAEGEESNILRGGKRFFCRVVATGSVRNKGG